MCHTDGPIGGFGRRRKDDFGAVCFQNGAAFHTDAARHDQFDPIASCCTDHGEGNTGISGGRFQDCFTLGEGAGFFGFVDHVPGWAVLDRASRIVAFKLGENANPRIDVELSQFYQRGVADSVGQAESGVGFHVVFALAKMLVE